MTTKTNSLVQNAIEVAYDTTVLLVKLQDSPARENMLGDLTRSLDMAFNINGSMAGHILRRHPEKEEWLRKRLGELSRETETELHAEIRANRAARKKGTQS